MAWNRKCFINNTVIDVCFRAEEDLPFVASPIIKGLLFGIFAKAQSLYPVEIVTLKVMANHVHMMLVVGDPGVVDSFMEYFKRESAHAVNKLLGREKHTVWCEGYDTPVILDAEKVMERIEYHYTNAQRANLVDKIEDYPNICSWGSFLKNGNKVKYKRVSRDCIPRLPKRKLSLQEQDRIAKRMLSMATEENVLEIKPFAWLKCFPELKDVDQEQIKQEIIARVRKTESYLRGIRTKPVKGRKALLLQRINEKHVPEKFGKRMICLSSKKFLRVQFVGWFKEVSKKSVEVFEKWKAGDWLVRLPAGMFMPGGILHANIAPMFSPLTLMVHT